jgi:hypothetical protein
MQSNILQYLHVYCESEMLYCSHKNVILPLKSQFGLKQWEDVTQMGLAV